MRVWAPRAALAPPWQTKQQRSSKVIPRCARLLPPPPRLLPLLLLHPLLPIPHPLLPIPLRLPLPMSLLRLPLMLPPRRARWLPRRRRQRRRALTVRPRPCRNECLPALQPDFLAAFLAASGLPSLSVFSDCDSGLGAFTALPPDPTHPLIYRWPLRRTPALAACIPPHLYAPPSVPPALLAPLAPLHCPTRTLL
jgi:hypothetical protein